MSDGIRFSGASSAEHNEEDRYSDGINLSFLETASAPDPQRIAPHRIECDCSFRKANPLGRPDSAYHTGVVVEEMNEPTKKKLVSLLRNKKNRNSKVEDQVADMLASEDPLNKVEPDS